MSAHAHFLQLQGQKAEDVDRVGTADVEQAQLPEKERVLLEYVKVLTLQPAGVRDTHVERLRAVGWKDEEIFEASFITSLFAFFNRMADAYGLDWRPGMKESGWVPPALRPTPSTPDPPKGRGSAPAQGAAANPGSARKGK